MRAHAAPCDPDGASQSGASGAPLCDQNLESRTRATLPRCESPALPMLTAAHRCHSLTISSIISVSSRRASWSRNASQCPCPLSTARAIPTPSDPTPRRVALRPSHLSMPPVAGQPTHDCPSMVGAFELATSLLRRQARRPLSGSAPPDPRRAVPRRAVLTLDPCPCGVPPRSAAVGAGARLAPSARSSPPCL